MDEQEEELELLAAELGREINLCPGSAEIERKVARLVTYLEDIVQTQRVTRATWREAVRELKEKLARCEMEKEESIKEWKQRVTDLRRRFAQLNAARKVGEPIRNGQTIIVKDPKSRYVGHIGTVVKTQGEQITVTLRDYEDPSEEHTMSMRAVTILTPDLEDEILALKSGGGGKTKRKTKRRKKTKQKKRKKTKERKRSKRSKRRKTKS